MKRIVISVIVALLLVCSLTAKTTYIPIYRSYIHIVNGTDTSAVSNNLMDLETADENGMFKIYIEHEDVTKEKVKAIKRAKRTAGWATFSAVMSGISTAFSRNSLQYMIRSTTTRIAAQLADIYNKNAHAEQTLLIDTWIENTSEDELMINDMERGLVWFVRPSEYLHLQLNNPDVANLRISDVHHNNIRYALVAAGSLVEKKEIEWEDDTCWIYGVWGNLGFTEVRVVDYYVRISKEDYSEKEMSIEEFKAYKKKMKGNK